MALGPQLHDRSVILRGDRSDLGGFGTARPHHGYPTAGSPATPSAGSQPGHPWARPSPLPKSGTNTECPTPGTPDATKTAKRPRGSSIRTFCRLVRRPHNTTGNPYDRGPVTNLGPDETLPMRPPPCGFRQSRAPPGAATRLAVAIAPDAVPNRSNVPLAAKTRTGQIPRPRPGRPPTPPDPPDSPGPRRIPCMSQSQQSGRQATSGNSVTGKPGGTNSAHPQQASHSGQPS